MGMITTPSSLSICRTFSLLLDQSWTEIVRYVSAAQ